MYRGGGGCFGVFKHPLWVKIWIRGYKHPPKKKKSGIFSKKTIYLFLLLACLSERLMMYDDNSYPMSGKKLKKEKKGAGVIPHPSNLFFSFLLFPIYSVVIFSHRYLDSDCINFKTFVFLAVYWSIWISSYITDIKVLPFLKWSLYKHIETTSQKQQLCFSGGSKGGGGLKLDQPCFYKNAYK